MYSDQAKAAMIQGDEFLKSAKEELLKAQEDVVPQMVCNSARQAIASYLKSFLLKKGIQNEPKVPLENLIKQCRKVDGRFNALDLEKMHCDIGSHEVDFCDNLTQVNSCLDYAKKTFDLIQSEPWPRSRPIK
jgi:hypothetical protein